MTGLWGSSFEGKVAIVTGASMGIGAAVSRALVEAGGKVLMIARREELGHALREDLGANRTEFAPMDVSDPETGRAAVARALDRFGRLDILINNAGIDHTSPIVETPVEDARQVIEINLLGALWMLQACGPSIAKSGGGSIVNVASRTALAGVPTMGLYGSSKAAILSLTRSAAVELAADGVRVNAVAPGLTRTPLVEEWLEKQPDREQFERGVAATIPQQRLAEPEEVAEPIMFLASDGASYITGATLSVDGGFTAA